MDQRQVNYLTMTRGVATHFKNNKPVWEGFSLVKNIFSGMEAVSVKADAETQKQTLTTTGHTKLKDELLEEMLELTYKAALKLSAYARITKDTLLLTSVKYSRSALDDGTALEIANRCSVIAEKFRINISNLADLLVTEEEVSKLEKAIEAFRKAPALRDTIAGERKTSTFNIGEGISSLKESFKILDELVESLIQNENFVNTYWNLRNIKQTGSGKTNAKLAKEGQLA